MIKFLNNIFSMCHSSILLLAVYLLYYISRAWKVSLILPQFCSSIKKNMFDKNFYQLLITSNR